MLNLVVFLLLLSAWTTEIRTKKKPFYISVCVLVFKLLVIDHKWYKKPSMLTIFFFFKCLMLHFPLQGNITEKWKIEQNVETTNKTGGIKFIVQYCLFFVLFLFGSWDERIDSWWSVCNKNTWVFFSACSYFGLLAVSFFLFCLHLTCIRRHFSSFTFFFSSFSCDILQKFFFSFLFFAMWSEEGQQQERYKNKKTFPTFKSSTEYGNHLSKFIDELIINQRNKKKIRNHITRLRLFQPVNSSSSSVGWGEHGRKTIQKYMVREKWDEHEFRMKLKTEGGRKDD